MGPKTRAFRGNDRAALTNLKKALNRAMNADTRRSSKAVEQGYDPILLQDVPATSAAVLLLRTRIDACLALFA
jgi:hypothetical protein